MHTEDRRQLVRLVNAIRRAWSRSTSADPGNWSTKNPAWGQCAVTALIVQDYFGGTLLRGKVRDVSHYWNRLASDLEIDVTQEQFGDDFELVDVAPRTRDWVLSFPTTKARYSQFRREVTRQLLKE